MATVNLDKVSKRFGRVDVIHGVSADIEDGEFIVIVGPSGCGKSTLLRMVAGLEGVSDGEIRIDGKRVNEVEPMDRDIAMVFQNYALYPHMSVRRNMGYGLKIAGTPKAEIERKVDEAAELLQLVEYLDRKPKALSGGQRQRVAMGRALVREPAVFLFDEPLSNLDAKLRVQMRLEIKALQTRLGVTSLYVTHDQIEAMTMADRMIVLNEGRVEQIGTPLDVYERPATLFAAQFIGSPAMNVFDGVVEHGEVRLSNGAVIPSDSRTNGAVRLGIRPEHLVSDPAGPLTMRVEHIEPLGASTLVHGSLDDGQEPLTASLAGVRHADDIGRHDEGSGRRLLSLRAPPEELHLFDPADGQRLD